MTANTDEIVTSRETMQNQLTTEVQGIASAEMCFFFELINLVILTAIIGLFGVVTNIINIIIFYNQGLTSTTNISFFALAISDLFSVATLEWLTICFNPLFIDALPYWDTRQVTYLTGAWPHICFGRITCWITAYMTAERCLCIALPLKVKEIVTPTRTSCIICFLYISNLASPIPFYVSSYLDWVYIPEKNHSIFTMVGRESRSVMEPIAFAMYAVLGTTSFPVVVLFTVILVYKLRRQRTWRMKSSSDQKETLASKKELQTMNMVVLIATILIVCYTPGVLASSAVAFVESFNIVGTERNLFFISWSFVSLFETLNSSVNIFLYYRMSSKYKQQFLELFSCCRREDAGVTHAKRVTIHVDSL